MDGIVISPGYLGSGGKVLFVDDFGRGLPYFIDGDAQNSQAWVDVGFNKDFTVIYP